MTASSPTKPYLEGKKLNKIEQNKANKDGLLVGSEIDQFAELGWEQVDETDLQLRLKWYGMFWRPKTPGKLCFALEFPTVFCQLSSSELLHQLLSVTEKMEAAISRHVKIFNFVVFSSEIFLKS
jgi:ferredoxin-nitrite reductase